MNHKYDVVVVGGGIGGVSAAVAASRMGASVLILEKEVCFGGTATVSQVCELDGSYTKDGRCVLPAVGREIIEKAEKRGAAKRFGYVAMSSNPSVGCDRIRFNPEEMKLVLDEIVTESGADILFTAWPRTITQTGDGILIKLDTPYQKLEIKTKILVDSTGNSEAVYLMDQNETIKTAEERRQGMTMIYRLGNVDTERFMSNLKPEKLAEIIQNGMKADALKFKILATCPLPGMTEISFSHTRSDADAEDLESFSKGILETRAQLAKAIPFLKANMAGLENAYLSSIASSVGVRERRKIRGVKELLGEEVLAATRFPDAVAFGCYPVDIHRADKNHAVQFNKILNDGIYSIPYRSLVSANYPNVITGSKTIFADDEAFAAFRTMPSILGIGNAAGIAAAIAAKEEIDLRELDVRRIQRLIAEDYKDCAAWLGEFCS